MCFNLLFKVPFRRREMRYVRALMVKVVPAGTAGSPLNSVLELGVTSTSIVMAQASHDTSALIITVPGFDGCVYFFPATNHMSSPRRRQGKEENER